MSEMTVLFLHVTPPPSSVCKSSHPLRVVVGAEVSLWADVCYPSRLVASIWNKANLPFHQPGLFTGFWAAGSQTTPHAYFFGNEISGLRRSPGGGHGNPLQCSCLESPWTEKPGGLQSTGLQRVRHDWATNAFTFNLIFKVPPESLGAGNCAGSEAGLPFFLTPGAVPRAAWVLPKTPFRNHLLHTLNTRHLGCRVLLITSPLALTTNHSFYFPRSAPSQPPWLNHPPTVEKWVRRVRW